MTYAKAAKLHNGDEVRVKKTGKVARVVDVERITDNGPPRVLVAVTGVEPSGLSVFNHTQIE